MDRLDKKNAVLGRLALLAMTFIWGTSFVVMKNTLESISTLYLLAVRFSGAALLMLPLIFRERQKLDAGYWKGGGLMGLCLFLAYVFQTYGLLTTTPGTNAFLTATYCILVPFLNWLIRGRRPGAYRLLAAAICLTGVGFVSLREDFTVGLGEGLTICCGLVYALHIVATNTWVKGRSPVLLTVVQSFTAAVLAWVTALFMEPFPQGIPTKAVWSLVYLCVMCTAVCFFLQTYGQKHTPPSAVSVIMTLESVFGVLVSILFGERPTVRMYIGFFLIFLAILVSETKLAFLRRKKLPA